MGRQRTRLNRVISEQPAHNLLDRRAERELLPMARTYGVAVLAWSPMAGGFLSGRYRRAEPVPTGSRFAEFWTGATARRHLVDSAYDVVEVVQAIATELSASASQVALAWCLAQPGITSAIIGPRTPEQLADSLGCLGLRLDENHLHQLDAVAPPGGVTVAYHGHDGMAWVPWGPHEHRW